MEIDPKQAKHYFLVRFGCRISDVVTYGVLLYFLGLE